LIGAGRRFKPSWQASLALGSLVAAFLWLGNWQLDRAAQKAERQEACEHARRFESLPPASPDIRYARTTLSGHFDPARTLLIDNQVHLGRAGVHVLTPFTLADGRTILVNRGWLPLPADRRSLPKVSTPGQAVSVSGILDQPYTPGRKVGGPDRLAADHWPQLVTYPDLADIAAVLGTSLYPYVLLLEPDSPAGFEGRDWKPVQTGAIKHHARALQWFTFVIAAIVIWVFLGLRRGKEQ